MASAKPEEKNYITPQGHQKLVDELNALMRVERPEVTRTVAWAAANGDRSENADYIYGKKRLREIDKRVRFLTSRVESAVVVDVGAIKSNKIQFGASVKLKNLDNEEAKQCAIVGVDEVDTASGRISWRSPLGAALLGKKVGDVASVNAPSGIIEYEILDVRYEEIVGGQK
ncbi:MAG: transcription elongation factor GreB [Bdellovibrionales bacterium GWA2_49_15]|nr:MAG: transcription elongation factor GreB [Bdellovibrionales bacterium GWA2_49_15]HAZ12103.1 transcription elongation factor GreB [Bdellovibrionales bacterium]